MNHVSQLRGISWCYPYVRTRFGRRDCATTTATGARQARRRDYPSNDELNESTPGGACPLGAGSTGPESHWTVHTVRDSGHSFLPACVPNQPTGGRFGERVPTVFYKPVTSIISRRGNRPRLYRKKEPTGFRTRKAMKKGTQTKSAADVRYAQCGEGGF
jgi:hypothetical protein